MFLWMLLLFTLLPAVEIWLFVQVPMDLLAKLAIVLFTGVAGAALARAQGLRVIREIQETLNAGSLPQNELIEGGIVLFGGALLLTPGFLTDTVGFLCLLPPSRKVLAALISRWAVARIQVAGPGAFQAGAWRFAAGPVRPGPGASGTPGANHGPRAERIAQPASKWTESHPHPQTGRLDLGAHVGRPAAPKTIDAAFSVIDDEED